MTKAYRLTPSFCKYFLAMFGLYTLMPVWILIAVGRSNPGGIPFWFPAAWVALWGLTWCLWILRVPYELRVDNAGNVELRSILRKVSVSVESIRSFRAPFFSLGTLTVKYNGGKIRLVNHFDSFYEFLWTLKSLNPRIETSGC